MGKQDPRYDPRIDAYIKKSAPFARPMLERLRAIVHDACPEVEETIKWSRPAFYHHGPMCGMAAFKAHMTFGFWMNGIHQEQADDATTIERLGRMESLDDLPSAKAIARCVTRAMAFNDSGVKRKRAPRGEPRPVVVPPELATALAKAAPARKVFDAFSPSQQREYCEWIADAKRDETKASRVEKTIAQLREGKTLNWKYDTRPAAKSPTARPGKKASG